MYYPEKPKTIEKNSDASTILIVLCVLCFSSSMFFESGRSFWAGVAEIATNILLNDFDISTGCAYIYEHNNNNTSGNGTSKWDQIAKSTASDGIAGDAFGTFVAINDE